MDLGNAGVFSLIRKLLTVSLLGLCTLSACAQAGRGSISGTITDPSGAIVPGAKVTAKDVAKGTELTTVSTGAGVYSFISVASGMYTITVTHDGFDSAVAKNVRVTVDQASKINVTLRIGEVTQSVTVDESRSLVGSENSTVGVLITADTIDRVPLATRDVYQLIQLSTGVVPANGTPNSSDTPAINNARSLVDVSSYTINGALQGTVYYVVDGSPIGVAENNIASIIPAFQVPEDGVDEMRVETQNTPATYTSGAAGVISLVTKSGTNQFHGDGFVYIRPNALAANDYFYKEANPGAPPLDFHRYQEGGSIGGPILKDKLFFFGDYEGTQQQQLETGFFTVPTAAEKTGDFSGDAYTIYNPLVPDQADGTRQPFANNKIPVGDLDKVALNFSQHFPVPNQAGQGPFHFNNYSGSGLDPLTANKFDGRVDYAPNEKNRIFTRGSYQHLNFGNADLYGSSNMYDPYYYVNDTHAYNVLLGENYTINPTSILQLRYSFTRHHEYQTGDPRGNNFDITTLGFPQSLANQVLLKQIPVVTFQTTAALGGQTNYDTFLYASENSDVDVSLTKVAGRHAITVGFEFQKLFMNVGQPPAPAGSYGFDNTPTSSTTFAGDGSDYAGFLLGMGSAPGNESGNFTKDVYAAEANPYYASFVQDKFQVNPKLTIDAGLRWEIFGGRTERHNRLEYFNPNVNYSVGGVALTGGEHFVTPSARNPFTTNLTNFAPRVAFAYQPQEKFVIRGGAGIYYGPSTEMVGSPSFNSDGFSSSTTWNATQYNADGNTVLLNPLSNPFPAGVVQPIGSSQGPATNIGVGLATVFHSPRTPTAYNFNLGIEQSLPGNTVFSLAYVGSRGLFLPLGAEDLNQLPLQTIQKYGASLCVTGGAGCVMTPNKFANIYPATNPYAGSPTVPLWLSLEPYPQFNNGGFGAGVVINGLGAADSEYSSLQTRLQKRMSHHFSTIASFTWGKIMTDDSQSPLGFVGYHNGAPQDWRNLNLEHSESPQSVRLQFNWQASYDLPIGEGRALNLDGVANSLLGGWTLNTIVYLSDGVPIASPTGTGDPYFNQRVNVNCDASSHAPHTAAQWFNYTCFSQPGNQFLPGTAPAYLSNVRTAGARDLDASIFKSFALPHANSLRLELAAYNVTNSVQFSYPAVFWNPQAATNPSVMAGFGQITAASNTPRQLQFAARYAF